ncbi:unnamed protein product, partial [Rotaria magnacalcarata]
MWKEPSHRFVPFIVGQLVAKRLFYSGSNNLSPILPPSFNISSDEGGSPAAAESGGAEAADFNTPVRAEFQFLGRGGPPEEWATPPPAPTKCGPETGAISKGVVVPPGEFVTSTPGVNEPNASPSMPSLIVKTPDIMKEFNPDDDDAFESSEEEESFAGFMRFGPSAEMVL